MVNRKWFIGKKITMPRGYRKDGSLSGIAFKKGFIPWNKGLTKNTDVRVLKYANSIAKSLKNRVPPTLGKHWKIKNTSKMHKFKRGERKSLELRLKCGLSQRKEKHWNWQGGKTLENKLLRKRIEFDLWRTAIFERDDYTCQLCGKRGGKIQAHHIKSWARYPELRFDTKNGITLCIDCHKSTNNYAGKKYE